MRTFKVIKWNLPDGEDASRAIFDYPFDCEHCGTEAFIPRVGAQPFILCIKGMGYIHEPGHKPPDGTFPQRVQCRKCRKQYQL